MKNTDLRAKARAIFGSAVAEPMPNQPNGAKALQQRANARPIPTYKVGGPVKKMPMPGDSVASGNRMSKMEADERRFMDMMDKKKKMPSARDAVDSGNRVNKLEGAEMRKMQMAKGGKAGRYADGGTVDENEMLVTGMRPRNVSYNMPPMGSNAGESMGSGMQASGGGAPYAPVAPRPTVKRAPPLGIRSTAGYTGPTADLGDGRASFGVGRNRSIGAGLRMPFKNGGKVQTSADTAKKLATEMGGMRKGGKVKPVSVDMEGLESMTRSMRPAVKDDLETKVMQARNLAATRKRETEETAPKKQSFNQAFGAARERGDKTFSWNGGSYGTQLKGETPKAAPRAAAPASRVAAPVAREAAPAPREAAPAPRAAAPAPRAPAPAPAPRAAAAAPGRVGFQNATPALSKAKSAIDRGLGGIDAFFEAANAGAGGAERARLANKAAAEAKRAKAKKNYNPSSAASNLEMALGGYAKGGKAKAPPKSGLAVMIAIGKAKPIKKMNGGPMASRSMDMESSKVTREMAGGGNPMGYAAGGAGKMRKGQAPIKKAQGGAAKVRKGMMTPEGNITHAMNKIRG